MHVSAHEHDVGDRVRVETTDEMTGGRNEREAVDRLVAHGVEGVAVIVPVVSSKSLLREILDDLPLVAIEGADVAAVVVGVDQTVGASVATSFMLEARQNVRATGSHEQW